MVEQVVAVTFCGLAPPFMREARFPRPTRDRAPIAYRDHFAEFCTVKVYIRTASLSQHVQRLALNQTNKIDLFDVYLFVRSAGARNCLLVEVSQGTPKIPWPLCHIGATQILCEEIPRPLHILAAQARAYWVVIRHRRWPQGMADYYALIGKAIRCSFICLLALHDAYIAYHKACLRGS
jgi:hypothetical protein